VTSVARLEARALAACIGLVLGAALAAGGPPPLEEARELIERGDYRAAIEHLQAAWNNSPSDAATLKWLCKAVLLAGHLQHGERLLGRLVELTPGDAEAWSLLGQARVQIGAYSGAMDPLARALRARPGDVPARAALALALVGLGRDADAEKAFEQAVSANALLPRPLAGPHASYAVFLLRLNRPKAAAEQVARAEALDPANPVASEARRALQRRTERAAAARQRERGPVPRFVDVAEADGLRFRLENSPTPEKHQIETMTGGVAVFDYDADGDMDLFFANGAHSPSLVKLDERYWNRLYRNDGAAGFTDVTVEAGMAGRGYTMGAAAADFDNDGFVDLFVPGVHENLLYHNNGKGTFSDVTQAAGLAGLHPRFGQMWGIHGAWADVDNDGWLDLLVVNYCVWDPATEPFCGDRGAGYRAYCHPRHYGALPNQLFRNNRDGTFTDVSSSAGIAGHLGKGMGAAAGDVDGDGLVDLFVANDTEPNFLFRNLGGGVFAEVAHEKGAAVDQFGRALSSMGADLRDIDGDGRPDLFVTTLSNEGFLLLRNGPEGFDDVSDVSQIGLASLSYSGWSNAIADLNNDGLKDLVSANGHAMDNIEVAQSRSSRQPNALFLNDGDGGFTDVSSLTGPDFVRPAAHRGLAVGDLDNDGRLDLVVSALGERPRLFRNTTPEAGHWLLLRLVGRRSNRDGLGAVLRLEADDGRVQWNHATTSVGFASSSDPRVHFGLGRSARVRELRVRWPSGMLQSLRDVAADRILTVEEPTDEPRADLSR
jgi:tetratricopeptide (TPR) repeat protein